MLLVILSSSHKLLDFFRSMFSFYSHWKHHFPFIRKHHKARIVYKKTDEWYIGWQRVVQRVTTNDKEWQQMTTSGPTSDKEWQREIQRVTTNSNEWQRVPAVVQPMKTAQYTSRNGWLPSFKLQKQTYYYFKGWMAAIRVVKWIYFP